MPLLYSPFIKTTTTEQIPAQPAAAQLAQGVVQQSMELAGPYTISISPPPSETLPRISKFAKKKKLILTKNINMEPLATPELSDPIRAMDQNYWLPSFTQVKINSKYNLEPSSTTENTRHFLYLLEADQTYDLNILDISQNTVCFFKIPYESNLVINTNSGQIFTQSEEVNKYEGSPTTTASNDIAAAQAPAVEETIYQQNQSTNAPAASTAMNAANIMLNIFGD